MKMKIDGRVLVAKSPDTARGRDLIELQRQTGWGMEQLRAESEAADFLKVYMSAFLTLHNAGFTPTWEEVLDRPVGDFEPIVEEIDKVTANERAKEGEAGDPPQALTDSRQGDSDVPAENAPNAQPATSKPKSRGSKTKSGNA